MSINLKFTNILRRLVMSHKMSVNCALSSRVLSKLPNVFGSVCPVHD